MLMLINKNAAHTGPISMGREFFPYKQQSIGASEC